MNSPDPDLQVPLSIDRVGEGPALVLVAGALCDRHSFAELAGLLGDAHMVFSYDRRGRGDSGGDRVAPTDVERAVGMELGDLSSVLDAAREAGGGAPPAVFGHSSGAVLALEAAAAGLPVARVIVYEPPWAPDADTADPKGAALIRELAVADRPADAALAFMGLSDAPPAEQEGIISQPWWPRMVGLARSLTYDLALVDGEIGVPQRMGRITCPTLVLDGGASWPWIRRTAAALAHAVPGARHESLQDQEHAVDQAVLAPVLRRFLAE